jgi:hypothetical protein
MDVIGFGKGSQVLSFWNRKHEIYRIVQMPCNGKKMESVPFFIKG